MDIFQRVFEPQLRSNNQKRSVGTHQMRAHTFARAQSTYHIHHKIPFLRYQEGFEDQAPRAVLDRFDMHMVSHRVRSKSYGNFFFLFPVSI